jgi:hypothetical protein
LRLIADMSWKKLELTISTATEVLFWASAVAALALLWNWDKMKYALIPMLGFFGAGLFGFSIMWFSGPPLWRKRMAFTTILRFALSIFLFYFYAVLLFWK